MSDDATESAGPPWKWLGLLAMLLVPLAVMYWPGCRQYPPASSAEALRLSKLVYAAANTKDPKRLDQAAARIEKAAAAGELSATEAEAFRAMVADMRAGRWSAAEQASFRYAEDQIGQGNR
jgi:hypothetical protein